MKKDTRLQSMCEELISSSWEKNNMENFDHTISIGQLVEQLTLNQWALGSSPRWCTQKKHGRMCKTFAALFVMHWADYFLTTKGKEPR